MSTFQEQVLKAWKNAGLNDNQARIITAEVGREGSFLPENLFGTHTDPKNKKNNTGMLSWQGGRETPLLKSLAQQGLIKNGQIVQSQKALDLMARYAVHEIKSKPEYAQTKKQFLENPNVSYEDGAKTLGRNFIRWRYDDPEYKSGHTNRDNYYRQLGGNVQNNARERYEMSKDDIVKAYREKQAKNSQTQPKQQPKLAKDDIVNKYKHLKASGNLPTSGLSNASQQKPIDGLPQFNEDGAFVPQIEPDAINQTPEQTLLDQAKGLGEVGLTALTGATSGLAGMVGGTAAQAGREILGGNFGSPEAASRIAQNAMQVSGDMTYAPRSEIGQDILEYAGDTLGALPPTLGGGFGLQAATLGRASMPQVNVAAQQARNAVTPIAQNVANGVTTPVKATANAIQGGVNNLKAVVGLNTPDAEPNLANVGAAQVDQATIRQAMSQDLPHPIQMTEGQQTRNPSQLKFEIETAKDPELGTPLRQRHEEQHLALQQNIDEFIDQTGTNATTMREAGVAVDVALQKQLKADRNRVRVAYAKADKSGEANTVVDLNRAIEVGENGESSTIIDYLNSQPNLKSTPIIADAKNMALSLGVARKGENGELIVINPTVKQMEKWRSEINQNTNHEPTNIRQAAILKNMIDSHVEPFAGSLYKAARIERSRLAKRWENNKIMEDLTQLKQGSSDRRVALEDIQKRIIHDTSLDNLRMAKRTILTSGEDGKQAWKDIQGITLQEIKDAALQNVAPDANGNQMVSPAALNKAINKLDTDGKLDFIFGKNGAEKLRAINDLSKALFTTPTSAAINHSNTASTLAMLFDMGIFTTSGMPIPVANALKFATKHIKDKKVMVRVNRALNPPKTQPKTF